VSVNRNNYTDIIGFPVFSSDGDVIGEAERVYLDDQSEQPAWVTVRTSLFRTHECFVPLAGAKTSMDGLWINYDKATVKDAPRVDVDKGRLSQVEEAELSRYYHLDP
jgi:hypothetical protein